ncbi:MAG: restriction endonuclease [Candidatus Limnocylindrales bacterium]
MTNCIEPAAAATLDLLEQIVVKLLRDMGYGGTDEDAGIVVGGAGDEAVDGLIKQERLGLDLIYVEAKRWVHPVSSPDVPELHWQLPAPRIPRVHELSAARGDGGPGPRGRWTLDPSAHRRVARDGTYHD